MDHLFITEDMTLVAVLKTKGIECLRKEKNNGGCRWLFNPTATLDEIFDEYNAEECFVEPKEFNRKLALVRRDMYSFLGHAPARVSA